MCLLTQDKKNIIHEKLEKVGYCSKEIEEAFEYIKNCSEVERKNGVRKLAPNLIRMSTKSYSIYTCLLKESVEDMLYDWKLESFGRVSKNNISIYKHICELCLNKADELISGKA